MSKLTDLYIHKASLQEEGKPIDPQWEMLEEQLLKEELLPELIEQLKTVLSKVKSPLMFSGIIGSYKIKIIAPKFGSFRKRSYLCSVRMSSEGANDLLSKQYSSWTFLTTLRGHSPLGYVLSFSIISEIICLMAALSGEEKLAELTTTALLQYCCLDTFAMVKIWEKLKDTAKEMP